MQEKIRWGILGPGTISQKFATGLKAIPDAEITQKKLEGVNVRFFS